MMFKNFKIAYLYKSLHLVVWLLIFLMIFLKDRQAFAWYFALPEDLAYVSLMAGAFYFGYSHLLAAYLKDRKFGRFLLKAIGSIILLTALAHTIARYGIFHFFLLMGWQISNGLAELDLERPFLDFRIIADFVFVIFYTVAGTQLRLLQDWVQNERVQHRLENDKLKAELKFLRAQISPHFLFNTLNSLYALAYNGSPETAPAIMRLSEIMRYMLYECNVEKVSLAKEVDYLKSLIELQKLRLRANITVNFNIEGSLAGKYISPLLLVMAVENSFKHGITHSQPMEINFNLSISADKIRFEATNPLLPKQTNLDNTSHGIGLENLRKRLEIIYPNTHELEIKQENQIFSVILTIQNNG